MPSIWCFGTSETPLAAIKVPREWLKGFQVDSAFEAIGEKVAFIYFPNGRGFSLTKVSEKTVELRLLSEEEKRTVNWGPFCKPWLSQPQIVLWAPRIILDLEKNKDGVYGYKDDIAFLKNDLGSGYPTFTVKLK